MKVENLTFDSNLFGFSVGRVELGEQELQSPSSNVVVQELLRQAYVSGIKLVYVFLPVVQLRSGQVGGSHSLFVPGIKVDEKITYSVPLSKFNKDAIIQMVYNNSKISIYSYNKEPSNTSDSLKELAIESGGWSRFKVDPNIPHSAFEAMFGAWLNNSVNRSIADDVFIARNVESGEDVGFITVKKRQSDVNIGLLAVSSKCRRQGIASMLLSRAVLWALESVKWDTSFELTVVTQGANTVACGCYEHFGFSRYSSQDIYHAWLPQHLVEPQSRSDKAKIPFCKQSLTGKELEYVSDVMSRGLDSVSRYTVMCAAKVQELLGPDCSRAIMVPSGTAALEMAFLLLKLKPGDEVIMPSYTFSSTANAVLLRGATPVFVDIRRDTLNIDERLIEAAITANTRAICCVHYAGIPCEMDTICDIANRHNLFVVEDAAQGFLSRYKGRPLGTIGDFGCFSFHYTKNIICGEGGAISINRNHEYVSKALIMWEKGTNRYDFLAGKIDKYEWIDVGSSYVPSEVSCAILWAQLEHAHKLTSQRRDNFEYYSRGLYEFHARGLLRIPIVPEGCEHNAHIFFVVLSSVEQRLRLETMLRSRGITAFSHYVPLHSAPAGKVFGRIGNGSESMTVTSEVFDGLLRLPVWVGLAPDDLEEIIDTVKQCLQV